MGSVNQLPGSVVVCIAGTPQERLRLARMFDGTGVLVMAPDLESAGTLLAHLREEGAGGLRVDLARHEATWHGRPLRLTPYELRVLACLARNPGRVRTYRQLHDEAWNGAYFAGPAAVRSVVKRLRAKLRELDQPLHIDAVRGLGFRLGTGTGPRLAA
jgi:DNA-binding response OmpR family regulator